jgi:hypothetical protein
MADPADIQLNLDNDQASQVFQQNVPASAQTTLAFKVEQTKVPQFFGQKGKDTISAIIFIRRIDDLSKTNNRNDTTTYANVASMLKMFAHDWHFATVKILEWEGDQLTWTNLKPRFHQQFATLSDDKLIIFQTWPFQLGLSKLAMKPNGRILGKDQRNSP